MKKTLSMLIISAAAISAAQAAVTLVSGFSHFGQGETAVSDLGSKSLSLSLANATRNDDGTFTTNPANNTKTMLDVSSLGLSGATRRQRVHCQHQFSKGNGPQQSGFPFLRFHRRSQQQFPDRALRKWRQDWHCQQRQQYRPPRKRIKRQQPLTSTILFP